MAFKVYTAKIKQCFGEMLEFGQYASSRKLGINTPELGKIAEVDKPGEGEPAARKHPLNRMVPVVPTV